MKNEDFSLIVVGEKIGHSDIENSRNQTLKHEFALYIDEDEEHKCDTCSSVFLNIENLKRHKRQVHMNQRKNTCEICGKIFFLPQQLT